MKTLESLIRDINTLHEKGHKPSPERLEELGRAIAVAVGRSLGRNLEPDQDRVALRMSNIGKPARQLWYEKQGESREELNGTVLRKFLMGDIWEELLLWMAEEAGHKVEHRQAEVNVDGIIGHLDAVIDGVVVDVKSASKYSFEKFRRAELAENDNFGYYEQLAGYSVGLGGLDGAWLAVNKETAALTVLEAPQEELEALCIPERITYLREVLEGDTPPEKCYEPVDEGKSGNKVLPVGCSYCPFKFKCWSEANNGVGLRTYNYSTGPKFFTHVEREPNVPEAFVKV